MNINKHNPLFRCAKLPSVAGSLICLLLCLTGSGCSTYNYQYVLEIHCIGRTLPNGVGSYVGFQPVKVSITCDNHISETEFDPMGQTRTLNFSERYRIMIDGSETVRGFTVHIQREGYKDWSADYRGGDTLMAVDGGIDRGTFIRLDSIELAPDESPQPSRRVRGGPTTETSVNGD